MGDLYDKLDEFAKTATVFQWIFAILSLAIWLCFFASLFLEQSIPFSRLGSLLIFYFYFIKPLIKLVKVTSDEGFNLKFTIGSLISIVCSSLVIYSIYLITSADYSFLQGNAYFVHWTILFSLFYVIYRISKNPIATLIKSFKNQEQRPSSTINLFFCLWISAWILCQFSRNILPNDDVSLYNLKTPSRIGLYTDDSFYSTFAVEDSNKTTAFIDLLSKGRAKELTIGEGIKITSFSSPDLRYSFFYDDVNYFNDEHNSFTLKNGYIRSWVYLIDNKAFITDRKYSNSFLGRSFPSSTKYYEIIFPDSTISTDDLIKALGSVK